MARRHNRFWTRVIPVTYYSPLLTVAYGGSAKDAALDGQMNRAEKLEEIAAGPGRK
jgi:heterodisulfide reductase subunit B